GPDVRGRRRARPQGRPRPMAAVSSRGLTPSANAMSRYVALLRGINVGGKNSVPMGRLREVLEELGFTDVATYIASGNVIFDSKLGAAEIGALIEGVLPQKFALHDEGVRVLVLSQRQLQAIVE